MEERRLGPVIGLGTWNTFGGDTALARNIVAAALEVGLRLFDSSPMYGSAEASLARALSARRADAAIATKVWARSIAEGRVQFARQLDWYGHVEIEQIHNLVEWEAQLEWLEEERAEGRIGMLGVTHYDVAEYGELARALRTRRFETVQIPLNPYEREVEHEVLPLAAELGVAVIVMRPLGGPEHAIRLMDARMLEPLRPFGVETWTQALLKWILSDRRCTVAIPATTSPEHMEENAAAGEPPWFGPEERDLVAGLAGAA